MYDEEIRFLGQECFVICACSGCHDELEERGCREAGAGEEDGEIFSEVYLAEEGFKGCLEKFVEALLFVKLSIFPISFS